MSINTGKILALIDHLKYDVPYSGNVIEDVIVVLEGLVNTNVYEGEVVPEGATHIDVDDDTKSKWIKKNKDVICFWSDYGWVVFDPDQHDMNLQEL